MRRQGRFFAEGLRVPGGQKGVALVLTLLILTLLVVTGLEVNRAMRVEASLAGNFRDLTQASYIAQSGVEIARALIQDDELSYDGLDEKWAQFEVLSVFSNQLFPEGHFAGRVVDENSKFNLNTLIDSYGNVDQKKRLKFMQAFKEGGLHILVATDVASRGLHIEGVTHVINYDLPQDAEDYVHRIGRTARAGASGKAISLADEHYVLSLEAIEEFIGHKIPVEWADDALFVKPVPRPAETGVRGRPDRRAEGVRPPKARTDRHPARAGAATAAAGGPPPGKKRRRRRRQTRKPAETPLPPIGEQ